MRKLVRLFKKHISLLLILGSAAFLRLYRIDVLMRFIWDEGRDMLAIRSIIVNQDLTLFGPFNEIDGKMDFFGVFHYYLMLPALWLANFNPVGPAVFTALLGVAAVLLTYVWAKKWLTETHALFVTGLMAVSPLVVKYTQWPWNPNTTGFFGILYLLSLQWWRKKPRFWLSLLAGLLLGLLFQLHYFTIALGAAAVLVMIFQKSLHWRQKLWHVLIFGAGFILPNLTFVIFDVTHDGFYRTILLKQFAGTDQQQGYFVWNPWHIFVTPYAYLFDVSKKFVANDVVGIGVTAVFFVWMVNSVKQFLKNHEVSESVQLATAWVAFFLLVSFFPGLRDDYHSAALWLALPVAVAQVTGTYWKKVSKTAQLGVFLTILLILFLQNRFWREPGLYENMPKVQKAAAAIVQNAQGKTDINVAAFVDSDTRATRFRYFIVAGGVTPLGVDQYPESSSLYVISPHDWEETKQNPAWELDGFRDMPGEKLWSEDGWIVYKIESFNVE